LRHSVKLSFVRVLNDNEASFRLDVFQSKRAVGTSTGQNDANRLAVVSAGKGSKKMVDRGTRAPLAFQFRKPQMSIDRAEIGIGRNHVNIVRQKCRGLGYLADRESDTWLK